MYALDKIMPMLLNMLSEGAGWKKHGVKFETIHASKKDKVKAHPEIQHYYQQIYDLLVQDPSFFVQPVK